MIGLNYLANACRTMMPHFPQHYTPFKPFNPFNHYNPYKPYNPYNHADRCDDKDDDKDDHHDQNDDHDCNDGECNTAADGVDITVPADAHVAILVVENSDDTDETIDDYVRIYAEDVEDPSNLDDYLAAAEEEYAARGGDLSTCDEVIKVVVEDADGKVIKVLWKNEDGEFTDQEPGTEDETTDEDDTTDTSTDEDCEDDESEDEDDCGGVGRYLKVVHSQPKDDDCTDEDDDEEYDIAC